MSVEVTVQQTVIGVDVVPQPAIEVTVGVESRNALFLRGKLIGDLTGMTLGQTLVLDASGHLVPGAGGGGGGAGTVTSVGLTVPNIFSVSGSPVTTTGALAVTLATQAANRVFSGPATGADAQPTFRALVAADIPSLSSLYDPAGTAAAAILTHVGLSDPHTQYLTEVSAAATYQPIGSYLIGAGGSDTQVQFNDGSALAGNAGFLFNKTSKHAALGTGTIDENIYITSDSPGREGLNVRNTFTEVSTGGQFLQQVAVWGQASITPTGPRNGTMSSAAVGGYINQLGTEDVAHVYGGKFTADQEGAAAISDLTGVFGSVHLYAGSVSNGLFGGSFFSDDQVSSIYAPANWAYIGPGGNSLWSFTNNVAGDAPSYNGAGTLPVAGGLNLGTILNAGGGTITTVYGLKVEDQTAGATNYAIYTGAGAVRFGGALTVVGAIAGSNVSGTNTGDQDLSSYVTASSATAFTNKTGNISQWTNDSGYLTSVSAHNLLSATHGDTTAGTVARGDLITGQGASPKWVRLAKGTANQVLAMDGTATDIAWTTLAGGGSGDVVGPSSSVDNTLVRFDSTTGKLIQGYTSGGPTVSDTGAMTLNPPVGSTALTIATATQTASFPAIDIAQTWNAIGVVFKAVKISVTPTANATDAAAITVDGTGTSGLAINSGVFFQGTRNGGAANVIRLLGTGSVDITDPGFSAYSFRTDATAVLRADAGGIAITSSSVSFKNTMPLSWSSTANWYDTTDLFLRRAAAATLQMGTDVNGAAVSQILQACNGITGTDRTGGNFTLASGKGTGASAVSSLIFKTPTVLASGTTAQSLATRLTLDSANATFAVPVKLSNAAVTGLVAGVLAASTNASIVLVDSAGQAYRIPCII